MLGGAAGEADGAGIGREVDAVAADATERVAATLVQPGERVVSEGQRSEVLSAGAKVSAVATNRAVDEVPAARRTLRVFDWASGAPVVDAEVYQYEPRQLGLDSVLVVVWRALLTGFDWLDAERERAGFFRTGSGGFVDVADSVVGTFVEVRFGAQRGYAVLGGEYDTGDRIRLAAPRDLAVRVVDVDGEPVPGARLQIGESWWSRGNRSFRTDEEGLWVLFGANTLVAALQADVLGLGLEAREMPLELGMLGADPDSRKVVDLFEAGPLELLGTNQKVRVSVVDHTGAAWFDQDSSVWLIYEGEFMSGALEPGRTVDFAGVPAGQEVKASLHTNLPLNRDERPAAVTGIVGPQGLDLELRLGPPSQAKLLFRAVDAAGEPLANVLLSGSESFVGERGGSQQNGSQVRTGDGGHARFGSDVLAQLGQQPGTYRVSLWGMLEDQRVTAPPVVLEAEPGWPLDLGDLVFAPAVPLVAGVVLDQAGAALGGVSVNARLGAEDRPMSGRSRIRPVRSAPDGSFAIFGDAEAGDLRVYASNAYGATPERVVPVGTQGVVLRMTDLGALQLTLAPGQAELAEGLSVRIQPIAQDAPEVPFQPSFNGGYSTDGEWSWTEFDDDGQVLWEQVPAGLMRVQIHDGERAIAEWEGVRVDGGVPTVDPRLQGIYLTDYMQQVQVDVVNLAGERLPDAQIEIVGNAGFEASSGRPFSVDALPVDLIIAHPGYLNERVTLTGSMLEVVLQPAPTVTLRLPVTVATEEGYSVSLALEPAAFSSDNPLRRRTQWWPVVGNTAEVEVMGLGAQVVLLQTFRQDDNSSRARQYELTENELDLGANCGGQTFTLELPPFLNESVTKAQL